MAIGESWTREEIALIRKLREVPRPDVWSRIQAEHFPGRSVGGLKAAFRLHCPDLVGKHGRGKARADGGARRGGSDWRYSQPEESFRHWDNMVERGTRRLGEAIEAMFGRQGIGA